MNTNSNPLSDLGSTRGSRLGDGVLAIANFLQCRSRKRIQMLIVKRTADKAETMHQQELSGLAIRI
jgi:hypothetical protein